MANASLGARVRSMVKVLPALWQATGGKVKQAFSPYGAFGQYTVLFNGEKNFGELGPAKAYGVDYETLRIYGWQHFLESELAHTIIQRYCIWVIGQGLKLQASTKGVVLKRGGIDLDKEDFNEDIEAAFETWSDSKAADFSGMQSLHALAFEAKKNAIVGGDVLVILRVNKKTFLPTVQLVDGAHVQSPMFGNDFFENVLPNGNTIRNGIEMNAAGEHVAYHIRKRDMSFERVAAKDTATGLTMAYMVNGIKFRIDSNRSIPILSAVFETIKKLERYKEATVAQAEEQNKNVFQIIQEAISDGTNPIAKSVAKALNPTGGDDLPETTEGRQLADKVAATTNKTAFFMPRGQKMENLNAGTSQLYFKDFYMPNAEILCATVGIPPNVALSKYDTSFSASRTGTKDWEHTLKVDRKKTANEFYQPVYELFLHLAILSNRVSAPGYLMAFYKGDTMVLAAYRSARFTGAMFPHIDPLKEVKAEREKLGPLGKNIPLTTVEKSIENLGDGLESDSIAEQFAEEREQARELGLDVDRQDNGAVAQPMPAEEEE